MRRLLKLLGLLVFWLSRCAWATVYPPIITFIAPVDGRYIAPAAPVLYVSAHPSYGDPTVQPPTSISRVDFLDGGVVIGTLTAPNSQTVAGAPAYAFAWTNPPLGTHLINARVTDTAGNSAIQINHSTGVPTPITVTIVSANPLPQVDLVTPTTGQIFSSGGSIPLTAIATSAHASVRRVDFLAGDTVVAAASTAPYSVQWNNPPPGDFALVAKAYDDRGAVALSSARYVRVFGSRDPAVVLTAPSPGATIQSGAPLNFSAAALAPDGSIGRVEFYAGTSLVGNAAVSPYEFSWISPQTGALSLTAKAYDLQGATAVSAPVTVTVGGGATPTVALTAPAAGTTFSAPATIALNATGSEAGGTIRKIEFFANGNIIGTATAPPYNISWTGVPPGTYVLMAKATDTRGATAITTAIAITVSDNQPPVVALSAPLNGQGFLVGQPIALSATAGDPDGTVAKLEFLVDAAVFGTLTAAPYASVWNGAAAGVHALTARATDNLGATATSAAVIITVASTNSTTVELTLPRNGNTFATGAPITLAATATSSNGTISRVEFYADGALLAAATGARYGTTWSNATAGTHTLLSKAFDDRGGVTASASVTIHVVTPALTITTPAPNASIASDFVLVAGTYQGPPNSGVTVNGVVSRNDGQGRYFVNNLPLASGPNTLTVILTTPDGQSTSQTQMLVSTGVAPMQIYAEQDADFAQATFTIRVTNRTASTITHSSYANLGGGQLDTSSLDQTTLAKITYMAPGVYTPGFEVTDSAGNTYTQTVEVLAQDDLALDQMLRVIWQEFTSSLAWGNRPDAMQRLSRPAQVRYGPVFDALSSELAFILASFSSIESTQFSDGMAEYVISRRIGSKTQVYLIYFLRDFDGVWHLESL